LRALQANNSTYHSLLKYDAIAYLFHDDDDVRKQKKITFINLPRFSATYAVFTSVQQKTTRQPM